MLEAIDKALNTTTPPKKRRNIREDIKNKKRKTRKSKSRKKERPVDFQILYNGSSCSNNSSAPIVSYSLFISQMKAGDLVKWYREEVASVDCEAYHYHLGYPAIVLEDYQKEMKILRILADGKIRVVHASECTLMKRGHKWRDIRKR